MLSSGVTSLLQILVCWLLVFKSSLGNEGAALANAISYWTNALLLYFMSGFLLLAEGLGVAFQEKVTTIFSASSA